MKTCCGDWKNCQYASESSAYVFCNCSSYCDYQLPKGGNYEVVDKKTSFQETKNEKNIKRGISVVKFGLCLMVFGLCLALLPILFSLISLIRGLIWQTG